jgi:hypothetical protein
MAAAILKTISKLSFDLRWQEMQSKTSADSGALVLLLGMFGEKTISGIFIMMLMKWLNLCNVSFNCISERPEWQTLQHKRILRIL